MKKQINDEQRAYIVGRVEEGASYTALGIHFNVDRRSVSRIYKRYLINKDITRGIGSGRPRITTERMNRNIIKEVRANRRISTPSIRMNLGLPNISDSTISRRIKECSDFRSYWSARKPFINEVNRARRVEWALDHLEWSEDDWRRVVWSDESPFVIRSGTRFRVWRTHNERYAPWCTTQTMKHEKKIMVWGCFAAHSVGSLHRIEGIMDKHVFNNILANVIKPDVERLFPDDDYMFQQDNDPKHTAIINKQYVETNINHIGWWPAQSPDLNPIENLWSILEHRLRSRTCNNEVELFNILQEGWNALESSLLTKLVDSMPRRCQAVIDSNGYATKY